LETWKEFIREIVDKEADLTTTIDNGDILLADKRTLCFI